MSDFIYNSGQTGNRRRALWAYQLLRSNKPLPPWLCEWLADALEQIAAGENANKAFGLASRGRVEDFDRKLQIHYAVLEALDIEPNQKAAFYRVSDDLREAGTDLSPDQVERIYRQVEKAREYPVSQ